jgi:FkbM family methyltransferase
MIKKFKNPFEISKQVGCDLGKCANGLPCGFKLTLSNKVESDCRIMEAIKAGQAYEMDVSRIFKKVLRPGDIAVDIGANVGWFSMLAASLVGPSGKVFSFEPSISNVTKLKANADLNNFKNIEIVGAAMSDGIRTAIFYLNPDGNGGHALWDMHINTKKKSELVTIKTTTIDERFSSLAPRLIKIDTEGHENRVLAGATKVLKSGITPFIISELHGPGLSKFGDSQESLRALMESNGYSTFLLNPNWELPTFLPPKTKINSRYTQNFLFTPMSQMLELYSEVII